MDFIASIEAKIIKNELGNTNYTSATKLTSPVVVIYADDATAKIHDVVVESLKSAWLPYANKLVFAKLTKNNEVVPMTGLAGSVCAFETLFTRDYGLSEFNYNTFTVFTVVSTYDMASIDEIKNAVERIDAFTQEISDSRTAVKYVVSYLDVRKNISEEFRKQCETNLPEFMSNKICFFIENRNSDGADLTDPVSEKRLFKNLSYIIRMAQMRDVRIAKGLHLISSQELDKPYYEMLAGSVTGIIERVNSYINTCIAESHKGNSLQTEDIVVNLGFQNNTSRFIDDYIHKYDSVIPDFQLLELMPFAEPEPAELGSTADVFNSQTMGTFFAYVDSIVLDDDCDDLAKEYVAYIEKNLSSVDILKTFENAQNLENALELIKTQIVSVTGTQLSALDFIKHNLKTRCIDKLLHCIPGYVASKVVSDARSHISAVTEMCRVQIPHGREDIYSYYRNRVSHSVTDNKLKSIGIFCNPEVWLASFINELIVSDDIYSASFENELAARMGADVNTVSVRVLDSLQTEDKYFTSSFNYRTDVDVAGQLIFMDADSTLWTRIKEQLKNVSIFDMPENKEINIMRVYTYRSEGI